MYIWAEITKLDACDVTLSVYPHRESLKNMPGHDIFLAKKKI